MPQNKLADGDGSWRGYCDNCACMYCDRLRCPYHRAHSSNHIDFCNWSHENDFCPRLDCAFFYNKLVRGHRWRVLQVRRDRPSAVNLLEKVSNEMMKEKDMKLFAADLKNFLAQVEQMRSDFELAYKDMVLRQARVEEKIARLEYKVDNSR